MTERHIKMFKDALLVPAGHDMNEVVRAVLPLCCSLANADGGSIVVGDLSLLPESVEEVHSALSTVFSDRSVISADAVNEISIITRSGEDFLLIDISPAGWLDRPVFLGPDPSKGVYRSCEGELFVSGRNFLLRMAKDSTEFQRDGEKPAQPVEIDADALADYRARLRELRPFPKWDMLGDEEFLSRIGALDGGEMTLAGAMMFGKSKKSHFTFHSEKSKPIKESNIRNFIKKALPKLASLAGGSPGAELALAEAFLNAIIHADYCAGGVEISEADGRVVFRNSGIPRAKEKNSALCRNPRIKKMLRLVGFTGAGMDSIKAFCADAKLSPDLEKWETELTIRTSEPAAEPERSEPEPDFYPVVSLREPTVEKEMRDEILELEPEPEPETTPDEFIAEEPEPMLDEFIAEELEPTPELPHFVIPVELEPEPVEEPEEEYRASNARPYDSQICTPVGATTGRPLNEPEPEPEELPEPEPVEPAPEYRNFELKPLRVVMGELVEDDEEDAPPAVAKIEPEPVAVAVPEPKQEQPFDPEKLPVIVQMVRRNSKAPAVVVREAMLDFCRGHFRSLPEISRALLRSEPSVKRRYIKPLLAEKALEVNERDEYRSVAE